MTDFTISLAGKNIAITSRYKVAIEFCKDYLTEDPADFHVSIAMDDVIFEQDKADREAIHEGIPPVKYPAYYLELLAIYRKIAVKMMDYGIILFHGSAISVDGEGFLFTAKSGTGKSTHTSFWRQIFGDRAVMVNDDKPLLRIMDDRVMVYGTPWNGKHSLGSNIAVPLKGICILSRAEENAIRPITAKEALPMLIQQSYRPNDPLELAKLLGLLDDLSKRTGLYALGCNMEQEAAMVAYQGMKGKEN